MRPRPVGAGLQCVWASAPPPVLRRAGGTPAVLVAAVVAREAEGAPICVRRPAWSLRLSGSGAFFHQCGVLLGHFFQRAHRLAHMADALALLLRGGRDLAHDVGHAAHRLHQFFNGLVPVVDQCAAFLHLVHAGADQGLDLAPRWARLSPPGCAPRPPPRQSPALLRLRGRLPRRRSAPGCWSGTRCRRSR